MTGLADERGGRREGFNPDKKKARLTALPFLQFLSQALLVPTLPKLGFLAPINKKRYARK